MKKRTWHMKILGSALVSSTMACGGATEGGGEEKLFTAKGAALHRAEGCDDLLAQIQADALAKLDDVIAHYQENRYYYYYNYWGGGGMIDDGLGADGGTSDTSGGTTTGTANATSGTSTGTSGSMTTGSTGSTVPTGPSGESDSGSAGDDPEIADPGSHSNTNTQVDDVDEADIVKVADGGKRIYLIHGSEFKIIASWPVEDLAESGVAQVPGEPFELFVHEDTATVFSRVFPTDLPNGTGNKDACFYGGETYTQISTFDVSGAAPQLEREMIFEGDYVSSRRHEDTVRAIVRGGFNGHDAFVPDVELYDSFGHEKSEERLAEDLQIWREGVARDIENTNLEDWLPESFEKIDDRWVEMEPQCSGYYIPEPGLIAAGVTQVVSFEPTAIDSVPQVSAVLGGSDTVYANATSLYVAQRDYRWNRWTAGDGPRTVLHKFAIEAVSSSYKGSGFVPGTPINQFALDERDGVLRIATTDDDWSSFPKNRIYTLAEQESALSILGQSQHLGEEGETIFAVRFIEDRGYVVTFRQTDPLYAVDLGDPADIKVLGELHVPGFSEYIHPLGEHHLLTIGQDAGEDGRQTGVALQIFDVTDAQSPQQLAKYAFGGLSSSEAGYNHKAFTYVKDYFEGGDDLLLFPLVSYDPVYKSGIEVLSVSESDGISHLGSIDHGALINRECATYEQQQVPCYYYYGEEMRRGMQIDQYIYALSQGGLTAHDIEELDAGPVATLPFERPVIEQRWSCYDPWYYGEGGYDGIGYPGDTTASTTTTGVATATSGPESEPMEMSSSSSGSSTSGTSTTGTVSMGGAAGN